MNEEPLSRRQEDTKFGSNENLEAAMKTLKLSQLIIKLMGLANDYMHQLRKCKSQG